MKETLDCRGLTGKTIKYRALLNTLPCNVTNVLLIRRVVTYRKLFSTCFPSGNKFKFSRWKDRKLPLLPLPSSLDFPCSAVLPLPSNPYVQIDWAVSERIWLYIIPPPLALISYRKTKSFCPYIAKVKSSLVTNNRFARFDGRRGDEGNPGTRGMTGLKGTLEGPF